MKEKERDDTIAYTAALSEICADKACVTQILLCISIVLNIISILLQLFL